MKTTPKPRLAPTAPAALTDTADTNNTAKIADTPNAAGAASPADLPKNRQKKSRDPKRRGRRVVIFGLVALFGIVAALVIPNFSKIKNALLLRFASPQVYMAYVEADYLRAQGKVWQENSRAFFAQFENQELSGAKANLHVNHLLASLLQKEGASGEKPDLSGMSLLFLNAKKEELSLFQLCAQIGDAPLVSLDFLTDAAAEQFYISCPQASSAALALSTAQDDPLVMLLHYLGGLLQAFEASIYSTVSSDPYTYLLPYLDVITDVTMERSVPIPASDAALEGIRLEMFLSLDTALDIAAGQLTEMKNAPVVTDPLLPCYELSIALLRHIAARYPADLGITAYVDGDGRVLGHEFSILSQGETLLSLTGILAQSPAGGKSGERTIFCGLLEQPFTISLSASQLGFDAQSGQCTGKVNLSCDRFSALHFQMLFGSENQLPKLSLLVRALGVTAASLTLTPTKQLPAAFPDPGDYTKLYHLEEFSSFLQSLDFSGVRSEFYDRTGISFSTLSSFLQAE